jgi:dihydroorotase
MEFAIRNGRVIDPATRMDGIFDVRVRDGRVVAIENPHPARAGDSDVEASGCWVVPGLIDPHVHLRDPGSPNKETIPSGLRAAAAGGFTGVAAMANTLPVNDRPEITRYMLERAAAVRSSRLIPVSAVTVGLAGTKLVDFRAMSDAGARLFSDDGMPVDDETLLSAAMRAALELDCAISLHEEDRSISKSGALNDGPVARRLGVSGYSDDAESARVRRDLKLALATGARVHIAHVSTETSLAAVLQARKNGARVTCEAAPHHFTLDEAAAMRWGTSAKMNPPLRSHRDVEALRAAIADGTIDMIATDHAPHDPASKCFDVFGGLFGPGIEPPHLEGEMADKFSHAANGVIGLETSLGLALALMHQGVASAPRIVEMMSTAPARLLGVPGGSLAVGSIADITVIDPNDEWTVEPSRFHSISRNTPFAGMRLKGRARLTIVDGEIAFDRRKNRDA